MSLLPVVSWDTCRFVEKRCIHSKEAEGFVRDVWETVIKQNPNLSRYWDKLFQILQHPLWGGMAMIAVCQLYRALEMEMIRMPRVDPLAFHLVDIRISSSEGVKYWRTQQNNFHYENRELSLLIISTSEEGVQGRNKEFSRRVIDTAFTFYLLLEEQVRLERSPIILVIPKSA